MALSKIDSNSLTTLTDLAMTGELTVDTDTLYVDSTNNNVGIGTSSPSAPLEISTSSGDALKVTTSTGRADIWLTDTDTTAGQVRLRGDANNLVFITNTTERMRIQSGGGISFNGDTAAANALDDYEEGTWTPVWQNATGVTYGENIGRYTKIGNICNFSLTVRTTAWTSPSGAFDLAINLPFAVHNIDQDGFHACASWFESGWSYNSMRPEALIRRNSQVVQIYGMVFPDTGFNYRSIKQTSVTSASLWVRLQGTYQVA